MMKNFLKNTGRKLIITDSVSGTNKVIRNYSHETAVYGVNVVTLTQLAAEIVLSYAALYEPEGNYKIIDENIQTMRLLAALKNRDISFLTNETKTISSAKEILLVLNTIRKGKPSERFLESGKDCDRISELRGILDAYKAILADNNELDSVQILEKAIILLEQSNKKSNPSVYIGILSSTLNANYIGGYFVGELSELEKEFETALKNILQERYTTIQLAYPSASEYAFFKSYGVANEIKHIKDIIVSEAYPLGEVAIIYPNENYERFLMSEFDASGFAYSFPRGFRALTSNYISFLIDLVEFAVSDFEYKKLYQILQNPVLQIKHSRSAYRAFLSEGIGYGRDRYLSFFERYETLPEDRKCKNADNVNFYEFLRTVIECFDPKNSCEEMFRKLVDIGKKYTDNKNLYRACVKDDLNSYANALAIWEGEQFNDKLFQIESFLKKLKCKTSENAGSITILPYGRIDIVDRKYIFAVGLSNENISTSNAESPVLCDKEIRSCVQGNVQLAMERNKRMKETFLKMLELSMQKKVYCSYSYYDTVSILSNSASLLFRELLEKSGVAEKDITCIGYEICKESLQLDRSSITQVLEQKTADDTEDAARYKQFSASSLQNLIYCPMSYYYEKVRRIPQLNFQERLPDVWLPANVKGNVFHHVMEKYVNDVILAQKKVQMDEVILRNLFEQEISDCVNSNPISNQATFETEKEEGWEALKRYITELHYELSQNRNKKIIGCEVNFEDVSYIGKKEINGEIQHAYELLLRGSVDRLDGILEDDGTLKLQIYDYKTGNLAKKAEEIRNGNQIQHHIYTIAMEQWASIPENRQKLENLFGMTIKKIVFDEVRYVFPYEENQRELSAVCQFDEKSGKPILPEETNNIFLTIVSNYQKGSFEEAIKISADYSQVLAYQNRNHCRYCNYVDVCRFCNN